MTLGPWSIEKRGSAINVLAINSFAQWLPPTT